MVSCRSCGVCDGELCARTGLMIIEYASSVGVSRRRVGVQEFDREGEEYWNNRLFVVGVEGKPDAVAVCRDGDMTMDA
jgi:hypothetical protein